jgi:hypothetical protein
MKYSIIMILLLILSINTVYSQDYEPQENIVFTFTDNNVTTTFTVSATSQNYEQQGFLLGWHWGLGQRMSEALEMSQAHVGSTDQYSTHSTYLSGEVDVMGWEVTINYFY